MNLSIKRKSASVLLFTFTNNSRIPVLLYLRGIEVRGESSKRFSKGELVEGSFYWKTRRSQHNPNEVIVGEFRADTPLPKDTLTVKTTGASGFSTNAGTSTIIWAHKVP